MDGAVFAVCAIGMFSVWRAANKWVSHKRRARLLERFGDAAVVDAIMQRQVVQGMTEEQLLASRGRAAEVARKVYKTKSVETWKYDQTGRNRFRSRVTLENGIVIGWESK